MTFTWSAYLFFLAANNLTPGPNYILLASSGGLFGFKRSLPHLLGIAFGFPLMLFLVLMGSDEVFARYPWIFNVLTALSLTYVLWLAIRIFRMGLGSGLKMGSRARPMTFFEAAAFQWVNGKAWQIALMTATLFAAPTMATRLGVVGFSAFATLAGGAIWTELGRRIAVHLARPRVRIAYYTTLAVALLLSTWPKGLGQLLHSLNLLTSRAM